MPPPPPPKPAALKHKRQQQLLEQQVQATAQLPEAPAGGEWVTMSTLHAVRKTAAATGAVIDGDPCVIYNAVVLDGGAGGGGDDEKDGEDKDDEEEEAEALDAAAAARTAAAAAVGAALPAARPINEYYSPIISDALRELAAGGGAYRQHAARPAPVPLGMERYYTAPAAAGAAGGSSTAASSRMRAASSTVSDCSASCSQRLSSGAISLNSLASRVPSDCARDHFRMPSQPPFAREDEEAMPSDGRACERARERAAREARRA